MSPLEMEATEGIGAFLRSDGGEAQFAGWMSSTPFRELKGHTFVQAWGNGQRREAEALLAQLRKQTADRAAELMADPEWVARIKERLATLPRVH
jgi:hypothetical protein